MTVSCTLAGRYYGQAIYGCERSTTVRDVHGCFFYVSRVDRGLGQQTVSGPIYALLSTSGNVGFWILSLYVFYSPVHLVIEGASDMYVRGRVFLNYFGL